MAQVHIYISGFVQGVGYRDFVRSRARKYEIAGGVKNLPDGRVEAVAQGKREDLEKLIEDCKRGPFLAEVEDVVVEWEESTKSYTDFTIIR